MTYAFIIFLDWEENPTITIVESISHPIEDVDFPTITLCNKSPNPQKWGFLVKLLDRLKIHCYQSE